MIEAILNGRAHLIRPGLLQPRNELFILAHAWPVMEKHNSNLPSFGYDSNVNYRHTIIPEMTVLHYYQPLGSMISPGVFIDEVLNGSLIPRYFDADWAGKSIPNYLLSGTERPSWISEARFRILKEETMATRYNRQLPVNIELLLVNEGKDNFILLSDVFDLLSSRNSTFTNIHFMACRLTEREVNLNITNAYSPLLFPGIG